MAVELFAYADESGAHQNPRYLLIRGYIGSPRQWEKFENSWRDVLSHYGIEALHAKAFFQRDEEGHRLGAYRTWTDKKAMEFLNALLSVIQQRRIHPIGGAVDADHFCGLPEGVKRFLTGAVLVNPSGKWRDNTGSVQPYYLALQIFLMEATRQADDGSLIHFRFDQQNVFEEHAVRTFLQIKERQSRPNWKKLSSIAYADRKHEVGLQAADLNAYVCYSYMTKKDRITPEVRHALRALISKKDRLGIWDASMTDKIMARLTDVQRKQLATKRS